MQPDLEAAELIDERPDERLDTARLEPYLREYLPGAEGPLSVRQFGGGKANLTYLVRFGDREFVLRRPPLGPIPPGAHDMRREYRVLSVLHRRFPPATRPTGWRVRVRGDAPMDVDVTFPVALEDFPEVMPALTAIRPVNAIAHVCEARPGLLSVADLPPLTPARIGYAPVRKPSSHFGD